MEFEIHLTRVQDVLDFVALATSKSYPIRVGNVHHWVNGKSFMEMLCLDFQFPVTAKADCSQEEFHALLQEADRFLLKR